jgi:hypothetical protein
MARRDCPTEPWPLQPSAARRAAEDALHARRAEERDAKRERGQAERVAHARGLDAAVAWELDRMAEEPFDGGPAPPPDPTKPSVRLHTAREDGRKYAVLEIRVGNRAGDDLVVEARKRIDG